MTHPFRTGDVWALDDGGWVVIESIRVACDDGTWYVEFAEDEHGNELNETAREQLRDHNPDKFSLLVFETLDADLEDRAIDLW